MPNWAETDMAVVLPTRNVPNFKSLFLSEKSEENEKKNKYFARTFLNDIQEENNKNGMTCLRVSCNCAWSIYSCLFEGYPGVKEDGHVCPTIKESIKECEVKRMVIHSVEPGMGFEESSVFDKDEGDDVSYESRDLYKDPWCEYLDDDEKDETLKKEPELE